MGIAAVAQSESFTEVDGSHEVSVRVIIPHAVSELENPLRSTLPHPQADGPPSRINIRIVNLGPTEIPELGIVAAEEGEVKREAGFVGKRFRKPEQNPARPASCN